MNYIHSFVQEVNPCKFLLHIYYYKIVCSSHSLPIDTENIFFRLRLNQTKIRLNLSFLDWFGKKQYSFWSKINRKMVITICIRFRLTNTLIIFLRRNGQDTRRKDSKCWPARGCRTISFCGCEELHNTLRRTDEQTHWDVRTNKLIATYARTNALRRTHEQTQRDVCMN